MSPTAALVQTDLLLRDVNEAQRQASDPRTSVWVGASAGSGKTKVLADRVSRLLLDGVRPERILCLTFTRAAAAEMAIRMTQRLSHWATCGREVLEKELLGLQGVQVDAAQMDRARRLFALVLACPGGMRIQTIHGFAQEVLRRFPLEAGLAPHFAVMDEGDAQALWDETLDDVLQQVAGQRETGLAQAFALLVDSLGEHSLRQVLREAAGKERLLREAVDAAGGMEALGVRLRERLGLAVEDTEATLIAGASRDGVFDRAKLTQAAQILIEKGSKTYAPRGAAMAQWLAADEAGRQAGMQAYRRAYFAKNAARYANYVNKPIREEHPEVEAILLEETQRLELLGERLEALRCAQETASFLMFALQVMDRYREHKATRAVLDYNDLIAKVRALFIKPEMAPWVLFKLDGGIDHILVDESQDTNPAQWDIVKVLADVFFEVGGAFEDRVRTVFCVGDEKQSIYSFQGADVQAFARMREHFKALIGGAGKPMHEVPMNVSFRSAPAVLRAVDAVFEKDEVRAGVSRDPVRHTAFRSEGAGRVEVTRCFVAPEEPKEVKKSSKKAEDWVLPLGYETVHNPSAELAEHLAARIKTWIAEGHTVYDKELKTERPMHAGDVMVLVQTRSAFVEHFVRAMKRAGVPVSGVDRMRLTEQLPVMDLVALMQFALLPEDDLTLACVLRGPLIGASEEQMMDLAIGREGSLWVSLTEKSAAGSVFAVWRSYLSAALEEADRIPPLPFLVRVLTQPCPADPRSGRRAIAARLGPEADDPLDELLGQAEAFGATHTPSLQAFLHWLAATEAEIKRELEQAEQRVRITTVHASKGLESPIVLLPDTMRVPQKQKLPKLLWDERASLPFYVPRDSSHAVLKALRAQAYTRQMEEYRRLLYVAMTRAADRLYVYAFANKQADAGKENWYNLIVQGLAPLHQEAVELEPAGVEASVVLADYARISKVAGSKEVAPGTMETGPVAAPSWLLAPPPPEPSPPRPLVPSRPSEEDPPAISPNDARFARGRILHRLLQNLPDVEADRRAEAAARFLANPQHGLGLEAQKEMAAEVLGLIDDPRFAPLFGPDSRAEQPLVGVDKDRVIAGQVDRLALVGDEVWVVDFKTNRPPPQDAAFIPSVYRAQMAAYRAVLEAVYPDRKVRCFLLWTYTLRLMEVG
ncbi:MAG: double-strand break repair helicase AddA [Bdellovibrionales bacterium]